MNTGTEVPIPIGTEEKGTLGGLPPFLLPGDLGAVVIASPATGAPEMGALEMGTPENGVLVIFGSGIMVASMNTGTEVTGPLDEARLGLSQSLLPGDIGAAVTTSPVTGAPEIGVLEMVAPENGAVSMQTGTEVPMAIGVEVTGAATRTCPTKASSVEVNFASASL